MDSRNTWKMDLLLKIEGCKWSVIFNPETWHLLIGKWTKGTTYSHCLLLHFIGKEDGATIPALGLGAPPLALSTNLPSCSPDPACFLEWSDPSGFGVRPRLDTLAKTEITHQNACWHPAETQTRTLHIRRNFESHSSLWSNTGVLCFLFSNY